MKKNRIKVLVVEDSKMLRESIISLFSKYSDVECQGAANGREALESIPIFQPDIVLLDLRMPVIDGNIAFNEIMNLYPNTRIVINSDYAHDLLIDDFMERGAKGFIPKVACDMEVLLDAVTKVVSENQLFIIRIDKRSLIKQTNFTKRQRELLPEICDGMTNSELVAKTGISLRGIEKIKERMYRRSGVKKSSNFIKYVLENGFQFLKKLSSVKNPRD